MLNFYNYDYCQDERLDGAIARLIYEIELGKNHLFGSFGCISNEDLRIAHNIKDRFSKMIIVGIGGALLNPSMLKSMDIDSKLIMIDDIIPSNIDYKISELDLKDTAVMVISKSGKSMETIAVYKYLLNKYNNINIDTKDKFYLLTSNCDSILYKEFLQNNFKILNHLRTVNGRFSYFSNVAIIPAIFCGFDYNLMLNTSKEVIENFKLNPFSSDIILSVNFLIGAHRSIHSMFSYANILNNYLKWYSQISAESIGKQGIGFTPMLSHGPMDQHTVLQLFLDGPKDKFFSMYYYKNTTCKADDLELSNILEKCYKETISELVSNKVPIRELVIDEFNQEVLSKMIISSVIEIVLYCYALNINPFTQSKVDDLKNNIYANKKV